MNEKKTDDPNQIDSGSNSIIFLTVILFTRYRMTIEALTDIIISRRKMILVLTYL
jgi:hypothetical protein